MFGDGWLPMGMTPERLPGARADYAELCATLGKPVGKIVVMGGLPLNDPGAAAQRLDDFREAGAARFVLGGRYGDSDDYKRMVDTLAAAVRTL